MPQRLLERTSNSGVTPTTFRCVGMGCVCRCSHGETSHIQTLRVRCPSRRHWESTKLARHQYKNYPSRFARTLSSCEGFHPRRANLPSSANLPADHPRGLCSLSIHLSCAAASQPSNLLTLKKSTPSLSVNRSGLLPRGPADYLSNSASHQSADLRTLSPDTSSSAVSQSSFCQPCQPVKSYKTVRPSACRLRYDLFFQHTPLPMAPPAGSLETRLFRRGIAYPGTISGATYISLFDALDHVFPFSDQLRYSHSLSTTNHRSHQQAALLSRILGCELRMQDSSEFP